jgi:hypothetical protein
METKFANEIGKYGAMDKNTFQGMYVSLVKE